MCICSVCMYNFVCLEKLQMQCYMFSPSCFSTLIALLVFPGRDALLRFLLYHFYWSSWLFFNTIILSKSYQDSHLSFFKVYLFYFKGKLERHFCWFTPQMVATRSGLGQAKAWDCILVSHVGSRIWALQPSSAYRMHLQGARSEVESLDS